MQLIRRREKNGRTETGQSEGGEGEWVEGEWIKNDNRIKSVWEEETEMEGDK